MRGISRSPIPGVADPALSGGTALPGLVAGIELVECSPPYDASEQTALLSARVIMDSLASMVQAGKLGNKKALRDRRAWAPDLA